MQTLNLPSFILAAARVESFRQYADVVFRSMQQSGATSLFNNSFYNKDVAADYVSLVSQRINDAVPHKCDEEDEELCILPPLFMQSQSHLFFQLRDTLVGLVLFDTGPVFPYVRIPAGTTVLGNTAIKEVLYRLYELMPNFRIETQHQLQQECDKQKAHQN